MRLPPRQVWVYARQAATSQNSSCPLNENIPSPFQHSAAGRYLPAHFPVQCF